MAKTRVSDVFKAQGQPTITYVRRDDGKYEKQLSNAIDSRGVLCLLTGPSKTGKTTLYTKVASSKQLEVLQIRCSASVTSSDFWKIALEKIDFNRVISIQNQSDTSVSFSGEVGGNLGWSWLANLTGKTSSGISNRRAEGEVRERILSEASPDHLLPVLKELPYLLVVEDFHYLSREVQLEIFQQWKIL